MATSVRPTAGGQAVAEKTGALLASYDLAMSDRRRALRGETDQVRIAYIPCAVQQYLRGPLQKVRRVSPEISRAGTKPWTRRLRIDRQRKCRILPGYASHHSRPGVVILPLEDAEVTWKIVVTWRRGRTGGALKALLDALFAKVTPEAKRQG
jgi:DNA-binding transcriptional LysR family regulator